MTNRGRFLEAAHRIGARIASQALWSDEDCNWVVVVADRSEGPGRHRSLSMPAGGMVYEGTAGIALFLVELHRCTGDSTLVPVIEGALRHAVKQSEALPPGNVGFYNGSVGIAYVAARAGQVLGRDDYIQVASRMVSALEDNDRKHVGFDVISGGAGAIPALFQIADATGCEVAERVALALGERLIVSAHREPVGWSWGSPKGGAVVRNLTGYAHGATGVGRALIECYGITGDGRFQYAAEQAFLYERQFFDESFGNWPDFRHPFLLEYWYHRDELARYVERGGIVPRYERTYTSAWCHGAPGIGLARLRAWELSSDPVLLKEADVGLRTTILSVRSLPRNYSLCHGAAGNCETLLYGAEALNDQAYRRVAEDVGLRGLEMFENAGRPWPCGTPDGATDPGLMLGEAGIGLYYLRLWSSDTPSVLLPRPAARGLITDARDARERERDAYVETYFGRTLRILRLLHVELPVIATGEGEAPSKAVSDVTACYGALQRGLARAPASLRHLLDDAFSIDRRRYELTRSISDFTEDMLTNIRARSRTTLDWDTRLGLSPAAHIVQTAWDWDEWLGLGIRARPPRPAHKSVTFLLLRVGSSIRERRLSPFTAVVCEALMTPSRLGTLVTSVEGLVSGGVPQGHDVVAQKVVMQVEQLYRAGLVEHVHDAAEVVG